MHYHFEKETYEGMKLLESLVPGTELKLKLKLKREPENEILENMKSIGFTPPEQKE